MIDKNSTIGMTGCSVTLDNAAAHRCGRSIGRAAIATLDIVAALRDRLNIDDAIGDDSIAFSLLEIARFDAPSLRLQAAFDTTLGHWLALNGRQLDFALPLLVAAASQCRE